MKVLNWLYQMPSMVKSYWLESLL